jgi:hypothetical protein
VTEPRRVTIEEYEAMSFDERLELLRERTITDLSQVEPEFLARSRAEFLRSLERRGNLDP